MSNFIARPYPKDNQDTSLREETYCPCPSETVKPALVAVDGGIPTYLGSLKSISNQLKLLNECAFDKSILSDDEHYALLEIELRLQELITGDFILDEVSL